MKEKKAQLESLMITEKDLQHRATVIASLAKSSDQDDDDDEDDDKADKKRKMGKTSQTVTPSRDDFSQAQALINKAMTEDKDLQTLKELTSQLRDTLNTRVNAARTLPLPTSTPTSSVSSALGAVVAYKSPSETILTELKALLEHVTDFKAKNDLQNTTQQLTDLIGNCDKERAVVLNSFEVLSNHLVSSFIKYLDISGK